MLETENMDFTIIFVEQISCIFFDLLIWLEPNPN